MAPRKLLSLAFLGMVTAPLASQSDGGRVGRILGQPAGLRSATIRMLVDSLARAGGPLVEGDTAGTESARVSFLYHAAPTTTSVVLVAPWTLYDFRGSIMKRVEGTDTWYLQRRVPRAARFAYRFEVDGPLTPFDQDPQFFRRVSTWRADPTNPRVFVYTTGDTASVLELSAAPDASWSRPRPGVARGTVYRATVGSRDLGGDRAVWIYRPAGYDTARKPYPVLVLTDGQAYLTQLGARHTLDNLIAAGRISPLVAVGVTSPQRVRDLKCNPAFGDFLAAELLPWLREREDVARNPGAVALGGYSFGGLAAACAALAHPGVIGMVLAQSGSFRHAEPGAGAPEGVARLVATSPRRDIRFYLEVGKAETGPLFGGDPSNLTANRHLRDVLIAKGYRVTYAERDSGHEPVAWRETLHLGLEALFEAR